MKLQLPADFLLSTALHKNTWVSWIPEDLHPKIPVNREIVISCIPADYTPFWVFWTPEGDILYCHHSNEELSIEIVGDLKCTDHSFIGVVAYEPPPVKPSYPDPPKRYA